MEFYLMNFFEEATKLIQKNPERNPRMITSRLSKETTSVRIIIGSEKTEDVQDIVLLNPGEERLTFLKNLIAEAKMTRAEMSLSDPLSWSIRNI